MKCRGRQRRDTVRGVTEIERQGEAAEQVKEKGWWRGQRSSRRKNIPHFEKLGGREGLKIEKRGSGWRVNVV